MTKKDDAKEAMVTVAVLRRFADFKEGRDREVGEKFEATSERAEEIDSKLPGYVRILRVEQTSEPQEELSELSVGQLRELCSERGIEVPQRARKASLIKLLEG